MTTAPLQDTGEKFASSFRRKPESILRSTKIKMDPSFRWDDALWLGVVEHPNEHRNRLFTPRTSLFAPVPLVHPHERAHILRNTSRSIPMNAVAASAHRRVARVIRGQPTSDGAGVKLTRVIGQRDLDMLDPFLLLDEFRSDSDT